MGRFVITNQLRLNMFLIVLPLTLQGKLVRSKSETLHSTTSTVLWLQTVPGLAGDRVILDGKFSPADVGHHTITTQ